MMMHVNPTAFCGQRRNRPLVGGHSIGCPRALRQQSARAGHSQRAQKFAAGKAARGVASKIMLFHRDSFKGQPSNFRAQQIPKTTRTRNAEIRGLSRPA
jgi:hypothetical protein